jgi:hypothetical protein
MGNLMERAINLGLKNPEAARNYILETFKIAHEQFGNVGFISGVVISGGVVNTIPNLVELERYSRTIKKHTLEEGFPSYSALDFFSKEAVLRFFGRRFSESGGHEQQEVMQEALLSGNITHFYTIPGWTKYPEIAIDEYSIARRMRAEGRMTIIHANFRNQQLPSNPR